MSIKSILQASSSSWGSGCLKQKDEILGHPGAFAGALDFGKPIWATGPFSAKPATGLPPRSEGCETTGDPGCKPGVRVEHPARGRWAGRAGR